MKEKLLTCIGCPMGCQLTVAIEGDTVLSVSGNTCPKGDIYARKEVTNPTRIVTSTIAITGSKRERIACKTSIDVPKDTIFDVMAEINRTIVCAPKKRGDVLIANVARTSADIVATQDIV